MIIDDPAKYPPELRDTLDGRARRWFFRHWPPQRLLPDIEPIYVKSWLYVFGVATLVALIMLFVSGTVLAIFGPEWWLRSHIGGWFGAMHYWAVQLFFLFMLAHVLAVFIMGAFRGRRVTWMLGVLTFLVAAVTGLTGFVSLQDFEGQWVATQAKDAINSTGLGGLLNLLNLGQILTLHVIVLPLATLGLAALHLLWVRRHGIAPPYDANPNHQGALPLAAMNFKMWANNAPADFVATTLSELNGTSETATYGPPYNNGTGSLQYLGPISFQKLGGIHFPVDAPNDLVIKPLTAFAPLNPALQQALNQWQGATAAQRAAWNAASQKAKVVIDGTTVRLEGGDTGPMSTLLGAMLAMGRSGALDGQLIDAPGSLAPYTMNYTKSLLFLEDSNYMGEIAAQYTLQGQRWGVMNEIGNWPGQPWLWFYSGFYQIPPWVNYSQGSDIIVIATVVVLVGILLFLPFIPGLRSLPRWIRLYRLVWRDYYRKYGQTP